MYSKFHTFEYTTAGLANPSISILFAAFTVIFIVFVSPLQLNNHSTDMSRHYFKRQWSPTRI